MDRFRREPEALEPEADRRQVDAAALRTRPFARTASLAEPGNHRCTTGSVEREIELGYDDGTPRRLLGLAMGVLRAPGLHYDHAKNMPIRDIHTYLVRPNKLADVLEESSGTTVGLDGQLFDLLSDVYERSDHECDIDITFSPSDDGSQRNVCRDLICEYVTRTTLENGRAIADRLENNTDKRSGLGLLFLIVGSEGREEKVVISRFPTDFAVYVEEDPAAFTVEFLERVFMKNKASYKAVVYKTPHWRADSGRAVQPTSS